MTVHRQSVPGFTVMGSYLFLNASFLLPRNAAGYLVSYYLETTFSLGECNRDDT